VYKVFSYFKCDIITICVCVCVRPSVHPPAHPSIYIYICAICLRLCQLAVSIEYHYYTSTARHLLVIKIRIQQSKAVPLHAMVALGWKYSFLISALDGGERSITPRPRFAPGKGPLVPTVQEVGWASEPVWTQRLEEKSFALPGIEPRSPGRP
jgi:hypothetical protein